MSDSTDPESCGIYNDPDWTGLCITCGVPIEEHKIEPDEDLDDN